MIREFTMALNSILSINSKWTAFLRRVSCTVALLWLLTPAVWAVGHCDLNSDGQVNVIEVQMGVNQSLGTEPCSSADINSDGQCNVVDVQLLINAALGGGCPAQVSEGNSPTRPWVYGFTPKRVHYVADVPCGGNGTMGSPECVATAISKSHYQCGDLHSFREGTYLKGVTNINTLDKNCTQSAPAVFKGHVQPNGQPERAKTVGLFRLRGAWTWFVGLEMTDQVSTSIRNLVDVKCTGCMVINNVIYESRRTDNLNSWVGAKNVVYGNVLYRPGPLDTSTPHGHNIYTQNDYDAHGWKYFIQNMSMELIPSMTGSQLMNLRSSSGAVSGFHVEKNLFAESGHGIWWNWGGGIHHMKWHNNYHFNHGPGGGQSLNLQKGPVQYEFTDNYLAKAAFSNLGHWGEQPNRPKLPSVVTGNEIYDPPTTNHIPVLETSGISAGSALKIPNFDVWDKNTYGGTFRVYRLRCNGSQSNKLTLAQWRTATSNCRVTPGGAGFDLNSKVVTNPTTNKVVVLKNEWQCSTCTFKDQARGNIYIANWANSASQTVNISPVVGSNKQYVVRYARDFFGAPAASGKCPSSGACNVTLPIKRNSSGGKIFTGAYVITGQP